MNSELPELMQDIIFTLTHKVRVLTLQQVATTWWPESDQAEAAARKTLNRLARLNLVRLIEADIRQPLNLDGPMLSWCLGEEKPDFGPLSYRAKNRWEGVSATKLVVSPTRQAANWMGGVVNRTSRLSEINHDINVANVYLGFRKSRVQRASSWLPEEALRRQLNLEIESYLPDALVYDEGKPTVIELAGKYPKQRFDEIHGFCDENGLNYEIW